MKWLVSAAGVFAAGVLALPGLLVPADAPASSLGARTIATATPAELAMIRRGPVTVDEYNTATGWERDCLRRIPGATAVPERHEDGRVDYGVDVVTGRTTEQPPASDPAVDRCQRLGEAVRATYVYDHQSFFSMTTPYPGLGAEVRRLRR